MNRNRSYLGIQIGLENLEVPAVLVNLSGLSVRFLQAVQVILVLLVHPEGLVCRLVLKVHVHLVVRLNHVLPLVQVVLLHLSDPVRLEALVSHLIQGILEVLVDQVDLEVLVVLARPVDPRFRDFRLFHVHLELLVLPVDLVHLDHQVFLVVLVHRVVLEILADLVVLVHLFHQADLAGHCFHVVLLLQRFLLVLELHALPLVRVHPEVRAVLVVLCFQVGQESHQILVVHRIRVFQFVLVGLVHLDHLVDLGVQGFPGFLADRGHPVVHHYQVYQQDLEVHALRAVHQIQAVR